MKNYIPICISLILIAQVLFAQDDGPQWLLRIDDAERVDHAYSELRQTITTSGGSERMLTVKSWSAEEGDLSLMVYTDPPRVRGDKILIRDGGDNIWYYMQRRKKIRHFVGHTQRQSAMGSDFSYEDLSTGSMTDDYTAESLGFEELDGLRCVKLKLTPTESAPSYDYLILWAGEEDYMSRKIDYYDEGNLLKTLTISDFRQVEGRTVAFRMEMVNHQQGSRTVMEFDVVTFAGEPDPSLFTQDALSRVIR